MVFHKGILSRGFNLTAKSTLPFNECWRARLAIIHPIILIDYMTTAPASDLLSGRDRDLDHSFVKGSNTSTADIVFLAR